MALHTLAASCDYGDLRNELIHNRLVVGMADKKTSEQLQLQSKLTLEEAVVASKQAELQFQQSAVLHREQQHIGEVNRLQRGSRWSAQQSASLQGSSKRRFPEQSEESCCQSCGLPAHEKLKSPACKVKCFKCFRLGHWASVCKAGVRPGQGKVFTVLGEDRCKDSGNEGMGGKFMGGLWLNSLEKNKWTTTVEIVYFERSLDFLIDTGADISCVPISVVPEQFLKIVKNIEENISGPDGHSLNV
ncbi:hypothetical protein PR048_023449 [Dryococelus australis]|uniref:Peptidase A2 domain-containing protein n=1 Tax=Dryococelus australis TaxID=614101 RepID=A0ABQ9GU47_9NEOP|nr:hypothetical protein PR048_023449 [Dryococelus australis]